MSTTGGVRKVKKVTKTVTKSSKGDGETTVETVTKMTSSSEASGRDGDMTNKVINGEDSGKNFVNGRRVQPDEKQALIVGPPHQRNKSSLFLDLR